MAGWKKFRGIPLQVNVTQDISDRIDAIAKREGVSKASVVRDIIDAGIRRREKKEIPTHV